jgi:hypothetical protein
MRSSVLLQLEAGQTPGIRRHDLLQQRQFSPYKPMGEGGDKTELFQAASQLLASDTDGLIATLEDFP